ncbi:MAG: hypothetical protein IPL41_09805 [Micropruina sp.]|nr:hypothetical protein [Micropruina sp.]
MTARARQWLLAAVTFAVVVAVTGGWLAYLNARSTPHHQQTAPGAQAVPDFDGGLTVRLLSLVVTPTLVTDKEPAHAPAGAAYVVALVDYEPQADGTGCWLHLLAVDGRRWSMLDPLELPGRRELPSNCSASPGDATTRAELIYLIPEQATGALAGLVSSGLAHRSTEAYPVLTPPQ